MSRILRKRFHEVFTGICYFYWLAWDSRAFIPWVVATSHRWQAVRYIKIDFNLKKMCHDMHVSRILWRAIQHASTTLCNVRLIMWKSVMDSQPRYRQSDTRQNALVVGRERCFAYMTLGRRALLLDHPTVHFINRFIELWKLPCSISCWLIGNLLVRYARLARF